MTSRDIEPSQFLRRYVRSPEFVLAVGNFALMVARWGFGWLDEIEPVMNALRSALPFPNSINEGIVFAFLLCLVGLSMLPGVWFFLLAAVLELFQPGDSFHAIVTWLSLPNAVLWGFIATFLFRLIRTGRITQARAGTLRLTSERKGLAG